MLATASPADLFWYDEFETARPLRSFPRTAARVLFQPRRFFARLDPEGSFLTALAFASGYAGVYAALSTISAAMVEVSLHGATLTLPNVIGATLANVGASVLAVWVLMPLATAIYHLFVRLLVGRSNRGYRATFRVLTYAGAADLVGWVPVVGPLVAAVWALVLATIGVREMHVTSAWRALVTILVPSVLLVLLAAGAVLWLVVVVPGASGLDLAPR